MYCKCLEYIAGEKTACLRPQASAGRLSINWSESIGHSSVYLRMSGTEMFPHIHEAHRHEARLRPVNCSPLPNYHLQ